MRLRLPPDDARSLSERFALQRPLEELEVRLVKARLDAPSLLSQREEDALRWALSLGRLDLLRHAGEDLSLGSLLAPFRDEVHRRLSPILAGPQAPSRSALLAAIGELGPATRRAWEQLCLRTGGWLPRQALEREVREKALVLVLGGGGGTAFVYVGVLAMLEQLGLRPSLLVGTSMGSILALFRSRALGFDQAEVVNIVRGLSWRRMFRALSTESRYGIPGALRLHLRAGIGRYFQAAPGEPPLRLRDLHLPTLVVVGGVRRGMLPRPLEAYAALGNHARGVLGMGRRLATTMGALTELATQPGVLARVTLGGDALTAELDAVDAAGFSSSLPGLIHYDVTREDPRAHSLLGALLEQRQVVRFVDGGLVDNLPAKVAWRAVHRGAIGTRNALVLALNGFARRLNTPHWLPLQQLAALNVSRQLPYAHVVQHFQRTLSPLDVVPSVELLLQAMELGRNQLEPQRPLITRLLAPLPLLPEHGF